MAWPKGKPLSEETKQKLSLALRGRPHSAAHNAAVAESKRGHRLGTSVRRKISVSLREERDLMQAILDLAKLYGWLGYHPWISVHSEPGFPDLTFVRGNRLLFIECKSSRGKVTPAQQRWLEALYAAGAECMVIRPAGSLDEVEAVLR